MAPRAPESREHLIQRLRRAVADGRTTLPFQARGMSHFSHVVVVEDGRYRLRRWVLDPQKGQAFLKAHGHFMPENAEAISEPGPDILLDAPDLEAFIAALTGSGVI